MQAPVHFDFTVNLTSVFTGLTLMIISTMFKSWLKFIKTFAEMHREHEIMWNYLGLERRRKPRGPNNASIPN